MTSAVLDRSPDLAVFIESVAPKHLLRDPFGLVSGYRAYLVYTSLSAKNDNELSRLGVSRRELPRVAMEVIFENHRPR